MRTAITLPALTCVFSIAQAVGAQDLPARCSRLAAVVPQGSVHGIPAGEFALPSTGAPPNAGSVDVKGLQAFCRVQVYLHPTDDSDIGVEVWLPADWNGKFQAVGNGAFTGSIAYPAMISALRRGYATASTDTGHIGG